jgi:colanic acid biosynthesis glycosyl transferase WcaI
MRILIVGINFWPEPTGTGKYTGEMAAYLSSAGHQVTVITAPPYYPYWKVQPGYRWWQYRTEKWNGVNVIRCPLFVPKKVTGVSRLIHLLSFAVFSLPAIICEKRKHPDFVFAVAPTLLAVPAAACTAKQSRTRSWLHIQDFEIDAALNLGLLKRFPWLEKIAHAWEAQVYKRFGTVSTISQAMVAKLVEKGVCAQEIQYFPNWIDTGQIYPMQGENRYRSELNLSPSDIVVLYSGSIGQKQGMEILVEAARRLTEYPGIHVVICGEGPGKNHLQQSADGLNNVHFLPIQPLEALNELLNMADIHALPQKASAADVVMPSKLLGMLASGRPVIAACPEGSELYKIMANVGVATPPEDPAAFVEKVLTLAADRDLRLALGARGRSLAVDQFSSETILQTFYLTVLTIVKP